jgi:hypothetical protein
MLPAASVMAPSQGVPVHAVFTKKDIWVGADA